MKIYTIGVGADSMTVASGPFGGFSRNINPSSELDESTLTYIAEQTGGLYFRARDPEELQKIYYKLDEIEAIKKTFGTKDYTERQQERYRSLIAARDNVKQ